MIRRISPALLPVVQQRWAEFLDDASRSRWYASALTSHAFKAEESDWNNIERVSVAGSVVEGVLGARVDRETDAVTNLYCAGFTAGSLVFARDLCRFVQDRCAEFPVVRWTCIADSPNEEMYRRWVERLGGRVVGRLGRMYRLCDGTIADGVYFEVARRLDARPDNRALPLLPILDRDCSVRTHNVIFNYAQDIRTLGDLADRTEAEMLKVRNLGRRVLVDLRAVLAAHGLAFRGAK